MKTKSRKKLIAISIIGLIFAVAAAGTVFLLWPHKPDPRKLLAKADSLSEQNLCLSAILKEDPTDEESWRRLLTNYAVLGADPFTVESTKQASGLDITLPEITVQREEPGETVGYGGILQGNAKMTDYEGCGAVATDGETVYYTTDDGIFADYHGLILRLTPARAERMIAAENGLYYLNATARRVQYIARDGHRCETLSNLPAVDFALLDGVLWIAGRDGVLYRDGVAVEAPAVSELCPLNGTLYAVCEDGLLEVGGEVIYSAPLYNLVAAEDRLLYIDRYGYPAALDPVLRESVILKEKEAVAVGADSGKLYYLTPSRKIKRIRT